MRKLIKEEAIRPEAIENLREIRLPLEELIRQGARQIIQQAIEVELEVLTSSYAHVTTTGGQRVVVRNGYQPERNILTTVGPVGVRMPKVRDRSKSGIKFNSALVPPYVRKTPRIAAALPWLYLKGISTGDMSEALQVLLGDEAKGLSPAVVSRLKAPSGPMTGKLGINGIFLLSSMSIGGSTVFTRVCARMRPTSNVCWLLLVLSLTAAKSG